MSDSERATRGPATGLRPRPWRLLLVGVATAVVVGAALLLIPRGSDAPAGSVVTLQAGGGGASTQCAPLEGFAVEALRQSDLAFSGAVTAVSADSAEIVPDRIYHGAGTTFVRLRTDSAGGPALDGPDLRRGERVLVSASGGEVAGCGLSAADSPELRRYYDAAFR